MHIRPVVRSDLGYIAQVTGDALVADELNVWLNGDTFKYPQLYRERCLINNTRRFDLGQYQFVMVTDEDDLKDWDGKEKVIGYATYNKKVGAPDDSDKRGKGLFLTFERFLRSIEATYIYYFRNDLGNNQTHRAELVTAITTNPTLKSIEKYWELDVLVVDPKYMRRGIGSELIRRGKEFATADRVPLILWASVMGEPMYLRQGFHEVDRIFVGERRHVTLPLMKWVPETSSLESQTTSDTA